MYLELGWSEKWIDSNWKIYPVISKEIVFAEGLNLKKINICIWLQR